MSGEGDYLVAESQKRWVVADGKDSTSFFMAGTQECERHTLGALLIEGRRRFVEEQEGLRQRESRCKEEALPLTTRELGGCEGQKIRREGQGFQEGGGKGGGTLA